MKKCTLPECNRQIDDKKMYCCPQHGRTFRRRKRAHGFLDKRCLQCNELLHASTHENEKERKKRDEEKMFCGGRCAQIYKSKQGGQDYLAQMFIYGRYIPPPKSDLSPYQQKIMTALRKSETREEAAKQIEITPKKLRSHIEVIRSKGWEV